MGDRGRHALERAVGDGCRLALARSPAGASIGPTWRFGASIGPKRRRKRHSSNPLGPLGRAPGRNPATSAGTSARSQTSRLRTPRAPATLAVGPKWRLGASIGPKRRRKRHSSNPLGPLGRAHGPEAPGARPCGPTRPRAGTQPRHIRRASARSLRTPRAPATFAVGPHLAARGCDWAQTATETPLKQPFGPTRARTGLKHRARAPLGPLDEPAPPGVSAGPGSTPSEEHSTRPTARGRGRGRRAQNAESPRT